MKLILKICLRELNNSRKFSFLFIMNLALGILGFLILHSFKTNINQSLDSRAKILLAADISISGRRGMNEEEEKQVNNFLKDKIISKTSVVELYSMGKSFGEKSKSRLVQIKIINKNYPLYGNIKLENFGDINIEKIDNLAEKSSVWISEELAYQFKLKIGDQLKLGSHNFLVADIIKEDSTTSWRGIGLAPKLYIHQKYQDSLKLLSFGSVANYTFQYKLKPNNNSAKELQKVKTELLNILKDPALQVRLPENSSEQVGRILNYLADYLGLVALVAVFLSSIGAVFLFQNYVFNRLDEIGILKTLGLSLNQVYSLFILTLIILGFCGVSFALLISSFLLPLIESFLINLIQMNISLSLSYESVVVAYIIGILLVLIVCLPILKKLLLKNTIDMFAGERNLEWSFEKKDVFLYLPLLISIEVLSVWQSHSIIIGTAFTLSLILTAVVIGLFVPIILDFIDKRFISKVGRLSAPFSLVAGLGFRSLIRSKIVTTVTFLAVSLGVMLLSLIGQLEVSLNNELMDTSLEKPSLFLFDIQAEQKESLKKYLKQESIPLLNITPMVRARISKIKGEEYKRVQDNSEFETREEEARTRFRNRGINLTYASEINDSQTIIEGVDFKGSYSGEGEAEVSLEYRYAKRLGLEIGDRITFEVLGVEFDCIVTSLRKIKWTSFLPNFFITLQPGVLENAPQTYLAAIKSLNFDQQLKAQDSIVEKYPNISIINVKELVAKILNVFATMSIAIKAMAILCIIVGFFVIYAIIQNQIRKKEYDILLMKSFGMSSSKILQLFLFEFLLMSLSATIIGSLFSLLLGNILSQIFFEGVWDMDLNYILIIIFSMTTLTVATVFLSTFSIYNKSVKSLLE